MKKKHALRFDTWAKIDSAERCKALADACENIGMRWQKPARYYWVGFIEGTDVKFEYWPSTGRYRHLDLVFSGTPAQVAEYIKDVVAIEASQIRREWLKDAH
jgi:hypothetical protein